MPLLEIKSNVAPSDLKSFVATMSKEFTALIRKPQTYIEVSFQKVDCLSFNGDSDKPAAHCHVYSIGNLDPEHNLAMSLRLAELLKQHLDIDGDRYYLFLSDSSPAFVGWNGKTFA